MTRERLGRVQDALHEMKIRITRLLADAGLRPSPVAPESRGDRGDLDTPSLLEGYALVMRDWAWGDEGAGENAEALALATRALAQDEHRDEPLGRMVVLGAGACRLAYDLHMQGPARVTVAVDINPLPFLLARRILAGESLRLHEISVNPRRPEDAAIERRLACPGPLPRDFHFLFADGRDPPLRKGAFDVVVTPWYIDQVAQDIPGILDVIHDLLRPGGRWLNLGPLNYPPQRPYSTRHTLTEVLALAERHRLSIARKKSSRQIYLQIPESTHARLEEVHAFVARRDQAPALSRGNVPAWLAGRIPPRQENGE